MNEISAALGLLQLKYIDEIMMERRAIHDLYVSELGSVNGISIPPDAGALRHNYASFPIQIEDNYGCSRDELYNRMKCKNIYSRRYFFPLITEYPMYRDSPSAMRENLPVASSVADRVLCLPIYPGLSHRDIARVIGTIKC
jgi:dTDP-4-amino-4,6-dideoxygalactose transaminase